jgi:Tfp pilus assembly protein PilN
MNIFKKLSYLINPDITIRIGIAGGKFVVSAIGKKGDAHVLSFGSDISHLSRWISPRVVYTTTEGTPIKLISADLDGADPEKWVVQHEEKLTPAGFSSDQIVNEWSVHNGMIYSATVSKPALLKLSAETAHPNHIIASLRVPLWDLGRLYAKSIPGPFIIWKIDQKGSQLGYVRNGYLARLMDSWVSYNDIVQGPSAVAHEIGPYLRSLCQEEPASRIIVVSDRENLPEALRIDGFSIENPKTIQGLPAQCHESYALSTAEDTDLDFAEHQEQYLARQLEDSRKRSLGIARVCTYAVLAFCAFLLLAGGAIQGISHLQSARLAPIRTAAAELAGYRRQLDSIGIILSQKSRYLQRESVTSGLLSDLQNVFPDGVYAEQISISEADITSWQIDISAVSYSSTLIPELLNKMNGLAGMSQVRLVYSEYTNLRTPQGPKAAIRFKISAVWKI